jgi:hypothetical protein
MVRNVENGSPTRPVWRAPKVDDLGNLRDFVQTGGINGKSGTHSDGEGSSTNEAKEHHGGDGG